MISVPLFESPSCRRHVLRFPAAPVTIIEVSRAQRRVRCPRGHALTPVNVYVSPSSGRTSCRLCTADSLRRSRARKK